MQTKVTKITKGLTLTSQNYQSRKYSILERIDKMPVHLSRCIKRLLPSRLGVTRQTFSNWCNAPMHSTLEIPCTKLLMLAHLFECSPRELLNTSIVELTLSHFSEDPRKKIKEITGLTN